MTSIKNNNKKNSTLSLKFQLPFRGQKLCPLPTISCRKKYWHNETSQQCIEKNYTFTKNCHKLVITRTVGGCKTRPSTCVKEGSIVIPKERSIGSSPYLLFLKDCKNINNHLKLHIACKLN